MTHAIHTHKSKDMNITTQTKPQVDQLELIVSSKQLGVPLGDLVAADSGIESHHRLLLALA